jgi:hypothetical protein
LSFLSESPARLSDDILSENLDVAWRVFFALANLQWAQINLSLQPDLVYSEIGNIYSKIGVVVLVSPVRVSRHFRFVLDGQAAHPSFELALKSSGAIKSATTVDFS